MNTKELKTEWEKEITTYDGKPVILKKDDVRTIITDAIDGASAYWCDYCGIEKPVKYVASPNTEPEAETLANSGTLAFYVTEPFEDDEEGNEIEKYILTLDKMIEGITKYVNECSEAEKENLLKWHTIKGEYYLNLTFIDGYIEDSILQVALFGEIVLG